MTAATTGSEKAPGTGKASSRWARRLAATGRMANRAAGRTTSRVSGAMSALSPLLRPAADTAAGVAAALAVAAGHHVREGVATAHGMIRSVGSRRGAIAGLVLLMVCLTAMPGAPKARAAAQSAGGPAAEPAPDTPPAAAPAFDPAVGYSVVSAALSFLQPRTLDPYTVRQLASWGFGGFTAIEPSLTVEMGDHHVRLLTPRGALWQSDTPGDNDVKGWSRLFVSMAQAAVSSSAAMRDGGTQGVLQSFFDELFNHLDPYSRYVAPEPASTDRAARTGGVAGAGISLAKDNRSIVISAVNANGPAWNAGVSAGMHLLAVDGRQTHNQDPQIVQSWLQGAPDSELTLLLGPATGRGAASSVTIRRAMVPPETVFAFSNSDIVVLRITGFSADTAQEMSQFLEQATRDTPEGRASPLRGLIIDLRGNRGGLLQQAVTSVALVLDHGVATITKGRDPQANHVWAVQGGDLTDGVPIVVLVDGRTASAAEIMAAALADHRRAVVVGSTTLGKGLVQTIAQLPDGGELFVTWSRVLAPLGWPLQGLGVMPQLCTSMGRDSVMEQLRELAAGVPVNRRAVMDTRDARAPLPASRILELRAPCPAAVGGDLDLAAARALIDSHVSYKSALLPRSDATDAGPPD
ncbi:S41 family peptidase [Rhizosaccharibacter radicis]|uniref:S41 family peptidase n=1 Tax=Rhizosaccharibacter radicis TaxID=2782605 RepID=A0ABT1W1C3_9PROT|nr:S41 family peptidase [Acetobacteraceae bacterium KSS12]